MTSRKNAVLFVAAAVVLLVSLSFSAVEVDRLRAHVGWLSDPARDGRKAGTPGAVAAADYVASQFEELGFAVQKQEFGINRRNVIARHGTAARYIVVGSHYDGQGTGYPSASDNAAGIAVLLELARDLSSQVLPVSLVFIAFDDEEGGLVGSRFYVENSPFPLENAMAAIIIDTMGRSFLDLEAFTLFALGTEYSAELADIVGKYSGDEMLVAGTDFIGPRSDFAAFAVKKVPYLFFSHATHSDYHGAGDTTERVNFARLGEDAMLIGRIIRDIAALPANPVYRDVPVYPTDEAETLLRVIRMVQAEKKDLPAAYALVFDDMVQRLESNQERETLRIAASALLAYATPRFSPFMLNFLLAPFYEQQNKPEIVAALREEAARW